MVSSQTALLCLLLITATAGTLGRPVLPASHDDDLEAVDEPLMPVEASLSEEEQANSTLVSSDLPLDEEPGSQGARNLAVCGSNTAKRSSYYGACKIKMWFRDGTAAVCSGFPISRNHLVTAAHCIYPIDKKGAGATAVNVYCGGRSVYSTTRRTTYATKWSYYKDWMKQFKSGGPSWQSLEWADAAVLKLRDYLPSNYPLPYGQLKCSGTATTLIAGALYSTVFAACLAALVTYATATAFG